MTNQTNPDIEAIKDALQRAGFLARERGIDAELDSETWTALYLFAESRGFEWSLDAYEAEDGNIPPAVLGALLDPMTVISFSAAEDEGELVFEDEEDGAAGPIDLASVEVFDLTDKHELNEKKCRARPRKLADITTIVLHQTGIKFGVGKRALAKYGQREALHQRFYNVACHVAALMNGDVLLVNPLDRYVLHGNSSNRFSIGIEIEGLYAGLVGQPKTVCGKGPGNTLTPRTVAAARKAIQVSVEQGRALGCPITKLAAHRSFHGSRISDPGEEIWGQVALWAAAELDLAIDYDIARVYADTPSKSGRKIPREWDPAGKVDYRGRPLKDAK